MGFAQILEAQRASTESTEGNRAQQRAQKASTENSQGATEPIHDPKPMESIPKTHGNLFFTEIREKPGLSMNRASF